jgi:hypothetical protein
MGAEDDECSTEAKWSIMGIVMEGILERVLFEIDPMRSENNFMAAIEI